MSHDTPCFMLSVRNAVVASGLGRTKLYQLMARGDVRAVKADGKTLIDVNSLRAYLDSLPSAPINPIRVRQRKANNSDSGAVADETNDVLRKGASDDNRG